MDKAWARGDVQTAREKSRNAKIANILGVVLGSAILVALGMAVGVLYGIIRSPE